MKTPLLLACTVGHSLVQQSEAVGSLFPSLSNLKDPHHSQATLAQLEKSVESLKKDQSQITPAVAAIVQSAIDTLDSTLQGSALGAILDDSTIDKGEVTSEFNKFTELASGFGSAVGAIHAKGAVVAETRDAVTLCRTVAVDHCTGTNDCVVATNNLYTQANLAVVAADSAINMAWCDPGNPGGLRDQMSFRTESGGPQKDSDGDFTSLFHKYIRAVDELPESGPGCQVVSTSLLTPADDNDCCGMGDSTHKITECRSTQTHHEEEQCDLYGSIQSLRGQYKTNHDNHVIAYNQKKTDVQLRVEDRKAEWEVIKRAVCYLSTLTESGRSTADVDGTAYYDVDDTRTAIEACRDKTRVLSDGNTVYWPDTTHLDLSFANAPDLTGMPHQPEYPCTATFDFLEPSFVADCGVDNIPEWSGDGTMQCFCSYAEGADDWAMLQSLPFFFLVNARISFFGTFELTVPGNAEWPAFRDGTGSISFYTLYTPVGQASSQRYTVKCVGKGDFESTDHGDQMQEAIPTQYSFCYGEPDASDASSDKYLLGSTDSDGNIGVVSNFESFLVHGGFMYFDSGNAILSFRILAPTVTSFTAGLMSGKIDYSLAFAEPVVLTQSTLTESSVNIPCVGEWAALTQNWNHLEGATHVCWQHSADEGILQGCCANGCFMYKQQEDLNNGRDRVVCYANVHAEGHNGR